MTTTTTDEIEAMLEDMPHRTFRVHVPTDVLDTALSIPLSLNDIVARLLDNLCDSTDPAFDIEATSPIDKGRPTRKMSITVHNSTYLTYIATFGVHNNKMSLGRILTYAFDNDYIFDILEEA